MAAKNESRSSKKAISSKKAESDEAAEKSGGKLSPSEAEAIMSADLPSGDPGLTPPAEAADQSPDYDYDWESDHDREGRK